MFNFDLGSSPSDSTEQNLADESLWFRFLRLVRWCIQLTRLILVCEVISYRLVLVRQNLKTDLGFGVQCSFQKVALACFANQTWYFYVFIFVSFVLVLSGMSTPCEKIEVTGYRNSTHPHPNTVYEYACLFKHSQMHSSSSYIRTVHQISFCLFLL